MTWNPTTDAFEIVERMVFSWCSGVKWLACPGVKWLACEKTVYAMRVRLHSVGELSLNL